MRGDEYWQVLMDLVSDEAKARWRAELLARYPAAKKLFDKQADSRQNGQAP